MLQRLIRSWRQASPSRQAKIIGLSIVFFLAAVNVGFITYYAAKQESTALSVPLVVKEPAANESSPAPVQPTPSPTVEVPKPPPKTPTPPPYPTADPCTKYSFSPSQPLDGSTQNQQFAEDYYEHLYSVHGHTRAQIVTQLSSCAPSDQTTGATTYGLTWVNIRWWYWNKIEGGKCKVDHFKIRQTTDIVYPEWKASANLPQESDLSLRWNNYNKSIRTHEEGHHKHGYEVRDEMIALLGSFPGYSTCTELDNALRPQVDAVINKLGAKGQQYDNATNHGQTQLISPHILWP